MYHLSFLCYQAMPNLETRTDILVDKGTGFGWPKDGLWAVEGEHGYSTMPSVMDYLCCWPFFLWSFITGIFRSLGCFRHKHTICDLIGPASTDNIFKRLYRGLCYCLSCCNCFFYSSGCCGAGNFYILCGCCGHKVAGYVVDHS
jgi:hypothetical protein